MYLVIECTSDLNMHIVDKFRNDQLQLARGKMMQRLLDVTGMSALEIMNATKEYGAVCEWCKIREDSVFLSFWNGIYKWQILKA